jgi:hypothetical protein
MRTVATTTLYLTSVDGGLLFRWAEPKCCSLAGDLFCHTNLVTLLPCSTPISQSVCTHSVTVRYMLWQECTPRVNAGSELLPDLDMKVLTCCMQTVNCSQHAGGRGNCAMQS